MTDDIMEVLPLPTWIERQESSTILTYENRRGDHMCFGLDDDTFLVHDVCILPADRWTGGTDPVVVREGPADDDTLTGMVEFILNHF